MHGAACGTPRARSGDGIVARSRTPVATARRAWAGPMPRTRSAPTRTGPRTRCRTWQDVREMQDAREGHDQPGESRLREDQAAAALAALTDGLLVSAINAPAGAGQTRCWPRPPASGPRPGRAVIGITPSQSARNTLAAGAPGCTRRPVPGPPAGRRAPAGPHQPGTLPAIDEASMLSGPDLRPDRLRQGQRRQDHPGRDIASSRRSRTAAACPCSPIPSATPAG